MGTLMDHFLETKNLQREIKHILNALKWSYNNFSGKYLIEENDYDVEEEEITKFTEALKKQLKRKTTKTELLNKYLEFLKQTSEYKKLKKLSPESLNIEQLKGLIRDYQSILDEEKNSKHKKVLEVAVAYALSIGSAWDFNIIPICSDKFSQHFLVIWEGDIGHNGGSGTYGIEMCEVFEGSFGQLYVSPSYPDFYTGLRFLDHVVGYENNKLILVGYCYDDGDARCCPSLEYKNVMTKKDEGKWELIEENFIRKVDWSNEQEWPNT